MTTFTREKIPIREVLKAIASTGTFIALSTVPVALGSATYAIWPNGVVLPTYVLVSSVLGSLAAIATLTIGVNAHLGPKPVATRRLFIFLSMLVGVATAAAVTFWAAQSGAVRTIMGRDAFVIAAAIVCGLTTFVATVRLADSEWTQKHLAVVVDRRVRTRLLIGTLLAVIVAGIAAALGWLIRYDPAARRILEMFADPGGIFAFIMGVATLAGVYLTLLGLAEANKTITTFPELLKRLCRLIEATDQRGDEPDYVRYLCYTPLTGSWATPKRLWKEFHDLVKTHRIAVVTLDQCDLKTWYEEFLGRKTERGTVDRNMIATAVEQAENAIRDLETRAYDDKLIRPVRIRADQMPGYYFFANAERAIVVAPVFLPLPPGTNRHEQIERLGSVQMVGIETNDPSVVSWVNRLHEVYRINVPAAAQREFSATTSAADLPKALDDAAKEALKYADTLASGGAGKLGFSIRLYKRNGA